MKYFQSLNGWQRLFIFMSLLWLPLFILLKGWNGLPVPLSDLPDDLYETAIRMEMAKYLPKKEFNRDKYLDEKSAGEVKCLGIDVDYISANQGTKRFIFNQLIEKKLSYATADVVVKKAIQNYLRIDEQDLQDIRRIGEKIVDPNVADKVIASVNRNLQKNNCEVKIELDGKWYSASNHSEDEVKEAYLLAKNGLIESYHLNVARFLGVRILQFFSSICLVYALGWMIAWVRRGFAK